MSYPKVLKHTAVSSPGYGISASNPRRQRTDMEDDMRLRDLTGHTKKLNTSTRAHTVKRVHIPSSPKMTPKYGQLPCQCLPPVFSRLAAKQPRYTRQMPASRPRTFGTKKFRYKSAQTTHPKMTKPDGQLPCRVCRMQCACQPPTWSHHYYCCPARTRTKKSAKQPLLPQTTLGALPFIKTLQENPMRIRPHP